MVCDTAQQPQAYLRQIAYFNLQEVQLPSPGDDVPNQATNLCKGDHYAVVAVIGFLSSGHFYNGSPKWLSIWQRRSADGFALPTVDLKKISFVVASMLRDAIGK